MGPLFWGAVEYRSSTYDPKTNRFRSPGHPDTLTVDMRLQIAATLLLAATTIVPCESETSKSGRAPVNPVSAESPDSSQPHSTQLGSELSDLRDAALSDDYAYRQVAHL